MKWLNEQEENYIRSKLPVIIKSALSESFTETAKNIGVELGHNLLASLYHLNAGAAFRNVENSRKLQNDILMHHYANHLGIKASHLNTVVNEYEDVHPTLPATVISTPTGIIANPNYALEKREYDNKKQRFDQRQRVLASIKGLQAHNMLLGNLASKLGDEQRTAERQFREANPSITRSAAWRGGKSTGLPPAFVPRTSTVADIHLLYADVLRKRRHNRRNIRKTKP